jgi:hypothetical protein
VFNNNRAWATLSLIATTVLLPPQLASAQDKPDWQRHIDWASTDHGAPDCPWLYVTSDLQVCLAKGVLTGNTDGNRSCVIGLASSLAKSGTPQGQALAYQYVLLTQCHNGGAQQTLRDAGQYNVVNYLAGHF